MNIGHFKLFLFLMILLIIFISAHCIETILNVYVSEFSSHPILEFIFAKNFTTLIGYTTEAIKENSLYLFIWIHCIRIMVLVHILIFFILHTRNSIALECGMSGYSNVITGSRNNHRNCDPKPNANLSTIWESTSVLYERN